MLSRIASFMILGVLLVILGAMSYVVQNAGKPEPPKKPSEQDVKAREQAMKQRMEEQSASRKRMTEAMKARQQAQAKAGQGRPGREKRPVNATAPTPPKPQGAVPAGTLDIADDWFRTRKPGEQGIKDLEKKAREEAKSATSSTPKPAPNKSVE
ncbi:MAG: hypothetical protein HUU17_11980 [Chthonomonadales bacterium]|nr:hypothetical protein [Chthonomonadales bacterium]